MLSSINPDSPSALDTIINTLIAAIDSESEGSDEYAKLVEQLVKLHKLKENEHTIKLKYIDAENKQKETDSNCKLKDVETEVKSRSLKTPFGISPDTLAIIAANLIGIGIMIGHEKANVITSKALGFVMKLK